MLPHNLAETGSMSVKGGKSVTGRKYDGKKV